MFHGVISAARRRSVSEVFSGATLGMVMGGNAWDWRTTDTSMPDARRAAQFADYKRLGATFVRFDLDWPGIQPNNSTTYTWTYFDGIINSIVAAGLKPLPIFHRTPTWAQGTVTDSFGTTRNTSYPASMSQFATFCAACVSRYKDRVKYWEVWNEPNLNGFWFPTPDAVGFTNMLKAVYPACKAADPSCFIISGGLSSVPSDDAAALVANTHPHPTYKAEHGFLTAIYANGGGPYFDAVGIHPYSWPLMPSNAQSYNGWTMMNATSPSVRSIMTANGDTAKKIWITEFGSPTGTGTNAGTATFQANLLTEAHTLAATYPWLGPIIWYEYWDHGETISDTESNFGLLYNNYLPKPAYNAYLHIKNPTLNAFGLTLQQGTSGYAGAVDTRLNQASSATAYGSDTSLIIGGATGTTNKTQALLRFDNLIGTGGNQIPAGATIVGAEVQLNVTGAGQGPSFHRMLQTWAGTDTWTSRTGGISLDNVEAVNTPVNVDYFLNAGVARFNVTADVQAWMSGASNFGWVLEPTREIMMTFDSSEAATVANRPKLLITYVVTGSPAVDVDVATFTTKTGDGVTSLDATAKTLTIAYGTAATSLRGQTFVTPGFRYRVSWTMSSSNATQGQMGAGTSLGGPQYRPTISGVAGINTFDFTATADTLYLTFQRASTGETTFSSITTTQIPEVTWANISPQPITPSSWSSLSTGVTVNSTTGDITIPATGTLLSAAGPFTTVSGKLYRLVWTVAGNSVAVPIGTSQGGATLKSAGVTHGVGSGSYEFTPSSTTTWIQFQRQTSGTAVISNIALQEVV